MLICFIFFTFVIEKCCFYVRLALVAYTFSYHCLENNIYIYTQRSSLIVEFIQWWPSQIKTIWLDCLLLNTTDSGAHRQHTVYQSLFDVSHPNAAWELYMFLYNALPCTSWHSIYLIQFLNFNTANLLQFKAFDFLIVKM